MTTNEAICLRITELCQKQNISYYTLAYRAAISKSTLMNIFHGTNPTVTTISKICGGFGITLRDFFQTEVFSLCEDE